MRNFVIGLFMAMVGSGLAFVVSDSGLVGLDMEKTALVSGVAGVLAVFVKALGDKYLPPKV